jgi:multidrug efflux system membrane fusion protein
VRLLLDTLAGVVAVPTAAVQQGAKGSYVYRLGADGTVAAVPVKLGPVMARWRRSRRASRRATRWWSTGSTS